MENKTKKETIQKLQQKYDEAMGTYYKMKDLTFSYNTQSLPSNKETKVEYKVSNGVDTWDVWINNTPSVFSIIAKEHNDKLYHVLYDSHILVKEFAFDKGELSYLPNMIEVWVLMVKEMGHQL